MPPQAAEKPAAVPHAHDLAELLAEVLDKLAAASRMEAKLIGQDDVPAYIGLSRSAWFRLRSAGKAPAPVDLPGAGVVFRRRDLDEWVAKLKPAK